MEARPFTMRRLFLLPALIVASAVWPAAAGAQFYIPRFRPVEVDYRQFATDHFRMIYQDGLHGEAQSMAALLEETLPEIRARVGLRRKLELPVVLNRYTDRSNGFLTPRPFRQEIEAVPIRGNVLSPRFRDWHETVAPHELAHAAHAESGRGLGIGWLLRRLGPDLARSLNLSGPRGINEGLAVWAESRLRAGAGRLHHSFFEMEFRAAMDGEDPWSLAQMLERPAYTRPFDRFYIGGAHLFEYLEEDGDVPFFRRARDFYYRMPLLGYGPALWYGTGRSPWTLARRLRDHYRREGSAFIASRGELTAVRTLASGRGMVHRRPYWLDDTTLLTYARGYHERPGFYRVDVDTGKRRLVAEESITEDVFYTLDEERSEVLFARYALDAFQPVRATADVYRLDLGTEETEKMTDGRRLFAPVRQADGSIWALHNVDRFNEWVRVDAAGETAVIGALEHTALLAVEPDPSAEAAAVLAHRDGRQDVLRAVFSGGQLVFVEPWLSFTGASIYDISWSGDGRYLLFTADPDGVANVFAWVREQDRIYQITNVPYGALEPSLSPDQRTVAFVNYRHERYDLATVPFDLASAKEWPRADVLRSGPAVPQARPTSAAGGGAKHYTPLWNLRPRVAYPFAVYRRPTGEGRDVHLGLGGGMGLEWSDPLQYWTARTNLYYQNETLWGRAQVRTSRFLIRPAAEIFRTPSTVVVRRAEGEQVDTLRVGREERGVGAAMRLPVVLASNVYWTAAAATAGAEYRTERLFGRDGATLRPTEGRVTVRSSASLTVRMQANPRDIQPNTGLTLSAASAVDVWSEHDHPSSWLRVEAGLYLPVFRESSTSVKLYGSLLAQSGEARNDLTTFLPRGYETENLFLGAGTFGKGGVELTRPLWYVDDGFILPPVYFKALYAYGFAESMQGLAGAATRRTVAGAGGGVELRLFHSLDVSVRWAPVYRFGSSDWSITYR